MPAPFWKLGPNHFPSVKKVLSLPPWGLQQLHCWTRTWVMMRGFAKWVVSPFYNIRQKEDGSAGHALSQERLLCVCLRQGKFTVRGKLHVGLRWCVWNTEVGLRGLVSSAQKCWDAGLRRASHRHRKATWTVRRRVSTYKWQNRDIAAWFF